MLFRMMGGTVVEYSALELADLDNDEIVSVTLEHDLNRSILCCVVPVVRIVTTAVV